MRAYYLETALNDEELAEASEMIGAPIEQVRIPYVLPAPDARGGHSDRPMIDDEAPVAPLKAVGILKDYGQQVLLVIPKDMHWYTSFAESIARLTGFYPYLIQTPGHRKAINNPGGIRIIDMHGMLGGKRE